MVPPVVWNRSMGSEITAGVNYLLQFHLGKISKDFGKLRGIKRTTLPVIFPCTILPTLYLM